MRSKSKRLAKNTLILTFKMLFLLIINLYTSRILLKALGVEDYGIYNAVGGIVTMFTIISGSITAAITRYLTYVIGKEDSQNLVRIFSTSVIVQAIIAGIIIIFAETIGLWFLNTQMNIPITRMNAANWVFHFSIITFAINLISIPYNAAIIAHEKMSTFAYISLYEGICKLAISYAIFITFIDTLIFYALSLCFLSVSVRLIYTIYCKRQFKECTFEWIFDSKLVKEMFGFAGWNFIGAASGLLRDQGGNIVINIFCGPSANAARGIAYQVNHAVQSFVSAFTTSLNPQITKSFANGESEYCMNIIFKGAKFSFYILLILSLPILFCTPFIVNLWLGQIPEHSVSFIRLVLILTLSESISMPLITAMLATGNIKKYQIIVGGLNMLNLPISYVFLKFGLPPESVFIIAIVLSQCCLLLRIILLKGMINLNVKDFFNNVYLKIVFISSVSIFTIFIISTFIETNTWNHFLLVSTIAICCTCFYIWHFGLNSSEHIYIYQYIHVIYDKFKKKYVK